MMEAVAGWRMRGVRRWPRPSGPSPHAMSWLSRPRVMHTPRRRDRRCARTAEDRESGFVTVRHPILTRGDYAMHVLTRAAMTCGLLALIVSGSAASAHLAAARSDVVGHVYVNDNTKTPAGNTVAGYDRHADG